jgi:hypothetical protein
MKKPSEISSGSIEPAAPAPESPRNSQRHFARDDFEFGSLLGIGALAQVVHVRDTYTADEYALKILDKKQLKRVWLTLNHHVYKFLVWESGTDYQREGYVVENEPSRNS